MISTKLMKTSKIPKLLLLTFILPSFVFGQENADGASEDSGGESSAEASVTGSASAPAASAPGTIESNPVVGAIRGGADVSSIIKLGVGNMREIYQAGGFGGLELTFIAIESGISVADALSAFKSGGISSLTALASAASSGAKVDIDLLNALVSFNSDVRNAALGVGALSTYSSTYQTAVVEAATLANELLTDKSIISTLPTTTVGLSSFSSSGYNIAFANLLANYGAIGAKGTSLASTILTGTLDTGLTASASTSSYLSYLKTYTGSATFGDIDATSSVLDIPVANISVNPGANITIGQAGSSSTVDVSSVLSKASSNHRNYRKAHIIGAAKDMTIAGSTTFTNSNNAEDHALVLGAADDFMLSGSNLTYTGSNLGLGAGGTDADSMYLVNTTITTGGNLAVGTLGTLNISTVNLVVGNANSATSDPDNVYLYANDLIQVNGLNFTGSRLDDVYMEAITVNLNSVAFPSTADVILKSRDGSVHFNTFSAPVVGGVNLTKVSHGGTELTQSHFDGVAGHHDSSIRLPNGTAAVKIRKQY